MVSSFPVPRRSDSQSAIEQQHPGPDLGFFGFGSLQLQREHTPNTILPF